MNFDQITRQYDGSAHKALSDNRDRYIAQSAASRYGAVAPLPQAQDRPPSTPPHSAGGYLGIDIEASQ